MAAKDSNDKSKTSKTARVMNLLSKKQDTAPTSSETGESTSLPPIISSLAPDAAVSGQIKDALTDFLENELGLQETEHPEPEAAVQAQQDGAAPSPEPAPPAEELPAASPAAEETEDFIPLAEVPVSAAPQETPAPEAPAPEISVPEAPAPEKAPPQAVSVPEEVPPFSPEKAVTQQQDGSYINVMQVLVEEKAEKYVKLFGLCQCERCLADVKALTLNHLPSKYVVMDQGEMIPKLTFYESKYSSDITAQLLHACKIVMKTPHHDR